MNKLNCILLAFIAMNCNSMEKKRALKIRAPSGCGRIFTYVEEGIDTQNIIRMLPGTMDQKSIDDFEAYFVKAALNRLNRLNKSQTGSFMIDNADILPIKQEQEMSSCQKKEINVVGSPELSTDLASQKLIQQLLKEERWGKNLGNRKRGSKLGKRKRR